MALLRSTCRAIKSLFMHGGRLQCVIPDVSS
jgi:hypothetical protein